MNIKMMISYDGTRYEGWQSQKHTENTIQGKIENILSRFFEEPIQINGSGRTDSGVHAIGQVANFHVERDFSMDELMDAFCEYLPTDISVDALEVVDERFHARLSAKSKWYRYRIWNSKLLDVFERKNVWQIKDELDLDAMKKAAEFLVGEHDFKSFCSNKRMKKSTVRKVFDINITTRDVPYGKEIILDYYGNGFLYNMVRIMTGTLVEVGKNKRKPDDIPKILEEKNRQAAGMTAPPMGLMLMKVDY